MSVQALPPWNVTMRNETIVVTGIGIVSPLGLTTASTWENLIAKKSGIACITQFDATHFSTQIAAEVKQFDDTVLKNKKILRQAPLFAKFAFAAADEALNDANLKPTTLTAARWGLVTGSGSTVIGAYDYWEKFQKRFAKEGQFDIAAYRQSDDFILLSDFAKTGVSNTTLALLLQHCGIEGYATSVNTACASSGQALGHALQVIRRKDADYVLAGGFDSMINPFGLASFILLDALSKDNNSPTTASRPFDLTRNGFVLGEGAAFLVLEKETHALKRGARIYAEFVGEGNSLSSYRITDSHPSGEGAIQAIQNALRDAKMSTDEIDCINAHGTSTKMNDLSETNAIKKVFGDRAREIPISGTKSQTGHLIAAAGALEAALSVLSIHHQCMPMTANLTTKDPDCDLDYVTEGPRSHRIHTVLSNSFGFGGSNSCLIFKRV